MATQLSYPFAMLAVLGMFGLADSALAGPQRTVFHIARSKNENIVYYDVRLDRAGRLDRRDPLDVYWRMLAEDGRREDLTWLERKLADGYEVSDVSEHGFTLRLSAVQERKVVVRLQNGRYRASTLIRGQQATLTRIYVRTSEGVVPKVLSVDLHGSDPVTGRALSERLTPQ